MKELSNPQLTEPQEKQLTEALTLLFDILIWAHADQTGGAEMACVVYERIIEILNGMEMRIGIVAPERTRKYVVSRLSNSNSRPDMLKRRP